MSRTPVADLRRELRHARRDMREASLRLLDIAAHCGDDLDKLKWAARDYAERTSRVHRTERALAAAVGGVK